MAELLCWAVVRGERLAERYELGEKLGEGGMGSVFAATHIVTGKRMAVKLMAPELPLSDDMITRFRREARAAGVLDTEHIVQVFDSGVDDGKPYIAMELLEGESLSDLEDRLGPLPVDLALRIVAQACAGVALAHAEGVVHRDIKPSNLFVAQVGERRVVKVLDFGIAKIDPRLRESTDEKDLTRTGTVLGSPHYISPEQVQAQGDVDARADVWALGVVLYEALCGRVPHEEAKTLVEIMFRTYMQRPEPVSRHAPWVPVEVEEVVMGALTLSASERYADASAFGEVVARLLPDGHALSPEMFAPLSDAQRATVVPRSRVEDATETDFSDAEEMRARWAEQLGQRDTELPGAPAEETSPDDVRPEPAPESGGDVAVPTSSRRPWMLVAVGALALAGAAIALSLGADDAPNAVALPPSDAVDPGPPPERTASRVDPPEPHPEPTSAPAPASSKSNAPPSVTTPPPRAPVPPPAGPGSTAPPVSPPPKGLSKSLDEFGG